MCQHYPYEKLVVHASDDYPLRARWVSEIYPKSPEA